MRSNKYTFFFFTFLIAISQAMSQGKKELKTESEDYYQFPIRPGQTNFLSGTMGELRATHFHAGIDIKTSGVEGLNVYAAADGYVERVAVSSYGYGNALYIRHPNNTVTVYAHLQKFYDEIAEYVLKQQYNKKKFALSLYPEKNRFKVKKGDIIAKSGNSGSSGGPHLHFEIRTGNHRPLNPLNNDFEEIRDRLAPQVQMLAITPLDENARVEQQFKRQEYWVERSGTNYFVKEPIPVHGNIGIELLAHDKLSGAANRNGIPIVDLYVDSVQRFHQDIREFGFNETSNILIHTNYKVAQQSRKRFFKLYIDDGNFLKFYETDANRGRLSITDSLSHAILIRLEDAYGNTSQLAFTLQGTPPKSRIESSSIRLRQPIQYFIEHGILKIAKQLTDTVQPLTLHYDRMRRTIPPSYFDDKNAIYLWPLREGVPDSAKVDNKTLNFNFIPPVSPVGEFKYYGPDFTLTYPKYSLFDTAYIETQHYYTDDSLEVFEIGDKLIPARKAYSIEFKPEVLPTNKERYAVYTTDNFKSFNYEGGEWNRNKIKVRTKAMGKFVILPDTLGPEIRPAIINPKRLAFRIRDERSGIDTFNAYLDGQWLLMNYDHKRRLLWSERLDKTKPMKGALELRVVDNAGNESIYQTKL